MRYVAQILAPGEVIVFKTEIHPIVYLLPALVLLAGVQLFAGALRLPNGEGALRGSVGLTCILMGLVLWVRAWIIRRFTEMAVTSRRVIFKRGMIGRRTIETSLNHIESLDVNQSMLGRLLNYGTVVVRGTGIGVQPFRTVRNPLALRAAAFGDI